MSRQSRMVATLNKATETATLCDNALPAVLAVIAAEHAAVHLKAQSYDSERVSGFTTEVDEDPDGTKHAVPVRSDPVGRAVVASVTAQDEELARIETAIRSVHRSVEELLFLLQPWQTTGQRLTTPLKELGEKAKEAALEEARVARENDVDGLNHRPGTPTGRCRSCARIDQVAEVHARRTVDGDPMGLCRWCYDFHRDVGTLPNRDELHEHHAGGKVRRRVAP